jgi:hypothetical protein
MHVYRWQSNPQPVTALCTGLAIAAGGNIVWLLLTLESLSLSLCHSLPLSADASLQQYVLTFIDHLSHADNVEAVIALVTRARLQLQQQKMWQQQQPEPGDIGFADDTTTAATAGLARTTLMLLKLLSSTIFDASSLKFGGVIKNGAFSEVHAATVRNCVMLLGLP